MAICLKLTEQEKAKLAKERENDDRYFKSGKPKKKYMRCMDREYQAEVRRINGYCSIDWMCAGNSCPLYSSGCDDKGRDW